MCTSEENNEHFAGISLDCHPCVINQTCSAARFAEPAEEQTRRVLAVAEAGLEESKTAPLLVQHVIRRLADAFIHERGESRDFDIYAEVREKSNRLALLYAERFQREMDASGSPFEAGLQIAAAGNIIDIDAKSHGAIDLYQELNSLDDDNLEDARAVGLDCLVSTISSGSVYPGTVLSETSESFQELFASANVTLSKGQANFETLLPLESERIFFLLRIKCDYMAGLSRIKKDSLVLMQGSRLNGSH